MSSTTCTSTGNFLDEVIVRASKLPPSPACTMTGTGTMRCWTRWRRAWPCKRPRRIYVTGECQRRPRRLRAQDRRRPGVPGACQGADEHQGLLHDQRALPGRPGHMQHWRTTCAVQELSPGDLRSSWSGASWTSACWRPTPRPNIGTRLTGRQRTWTRSPASTAGTSTSARYSTRRAACPVRFLSKMQWGAGAWRTAATRIS